MRSAHAMDPEVLARAEVCLRHFRVQVQSLPGALPAQMVRPSAGKVTWLLDSDSASAIGAHAWTAENSKAFPRSNMAAKKA